MEKPANGGPPTSGLPHPGVGTEAAFKFVDRVAQAHKAGGHDAAQQVAAGHPRQLAETAVFLTVPPEQRPTLLSALQKLDESELAHLMASYAGVFWQGFNWARTAQGT